MRTRNSAVLVLAAVCSAAALRAQPALVTRPMPFMGITPCRIVDTRLASMPAGYGPPSLSAGGPPRDFKLAGQCGIPLEGVQAVSLNVTVVNPQGLGYVLLYPSGGAQPGVSTLNFVAGQTVANAAIVPLNVAGAIAVLAALSPTDLLLDVNGYYFASAKDESNMLLGVSAGNSTMTEYGNVAIGNLALAANTSGFSNSAVGFNALPANTTGSSNLAAGAYSLFSNTQGYRNTAVGSGTMAANTGGLDNTAVGQQALSHTATLERHAAVGGASLRDLTAGERDTAIGYSSGVFLQSGWYNLYLAGPGAANEDETIRIGDPDFHLRMFVAGVRGVTVGAGPIPPQIDSLGQLGTAVSTRTAKTDIRDMGEESEALRRLRPITFFYKDLHERLQYGLLAEEVEQILPDLVVCDLGGEPEAVLYQELPAMVLNEVKKQQGRLERRDEELDARQSRIEQQGSQGVAQDRALEELAVWVSRLESGEEEP